MTIGGTDATLESLPSTNVHPVGDAGDTVPWQFTVTPPDTVDGVHCNAERWGETSTVSVAVCLVPPYVALIVAVSVGGTFNPTTVNAATVEPANTVTVDGTSTFATSLVRVTTAPPSGAGVGSVTVAGTDEPPATDATPASESAIVLIVSVAVCATP